MFTVSLAQTVRDFLSSVTKFLPLRIPRVESVRACFPVKF